MTRTDWIKTGLASLACAALGGTPALAESCAAVCVLWIVEGDGGPQATLVDPATGGAQELGMLDGTVQALFPGDDGRTVVTSGGVFAIDAGGVEELAPALPGDDVELIASEDGGALTITGFSWSGEGDPVCHAFTLTGGAWTEASSQSGLPMETCDTPAEDLRAGACVGPDCAESYDPPGGALRGALEWTTDEDITGTLAPAGAAYRLMYKLVMGDTLHVLGPVLLLDAQGAVVQTLGASEDQFTLWQHGALVLATDQYSGAQPLVIDLAAGRILWEADEGMAVWLEP